MCKTTYDDDETGYCGGEFIPEGASSENFIAAEMCCVCPNGGDGDAGGTGTDGLGGGGGGGGNAPPAPNQGWAGGGGGSGVVIVRYRTSD